MTFDLDTSARADQLRRASLTPMDPGDANPGFFEGALSAPLSGIARGVLGKPALLAGEALTPPLRPIARSIDSIFGTDAVGYLERERRKNIEFVKAHTVDPTATGFAGQMLHGAFDIIPGAVMGGPETAGILEGTTQMILAREKGVDEKTAIKLGLVQGTAVGVGVAIPMSLGLKAPADLAWTAASNILPGIASRGASHQILADAGYKDMAEQYKALDADAILADGVMGLFFGAAGRVVHGMEARAAERARAKVMPDDVDAALTMKAQHHIELDTAPGVPRNPEARDAHVEAALKASDDLLAGRPVEVGPRVSEADFQVNPARREFAKVMHEEARAHLGDAYDRVLKEPLGPTNDPLVRVTAEQIGEVLIERGPAWPAKGEAEVNVGGYGLVKIIWKHGEKSAKTVENQVTREDVLRIPEVLNDYAPIADRTSDKGHRTVEWQVERQDGKRVVYASTSFVEQGAAGPQHLVSVYVNEGKTAKVKKMPLSEAKNRPVTESPGGAFKARPGDTGPDSFSSPPGGREGGTGESVAPVAGEGKSGGAEPVEVALMHQALENRPDLTVTGEDGLPVKAADLMKAADDEVAQAKEMAKGYEAAAACFLRTGS